MLLYIYIFVIYISCACGHKFVSASNDSWNSSRDNSILLESWETIVIRLFSQVISVLRRIFGIPVWYSYNKSYGSCGREITFGVARKKAFCFFLTILYRLVFPHIWRRTYFFSLENITPISNDSSRKLTSI